MSSYSELANKDSDYRKAKRSFKRGKVCARCNEYKSGEMTIDHIIPMWQFTGSYKDTSNWQVLCVQCHRIKTREEGFGVGYVRRTDVEETISSNDSIPTPTWYSLRALFDATPLSSLDMYAPTENYISYLLDEWADREKQRKAIKSLKFDSPKLKGLLSTSGTHSQTMHKFESVFKTMETGSPLSTHVHDDDSYLVIGGDVQVQDYIKLDSKERYTFLKHFLTCQDTPYKMVIFPKGVPDNLTNHALYLTEANTEKKRSLPGIAILGEIIAPEINTNHGTLEVIYNPETLKFSFAYRK